MDDRGGYKLEFFFHQSVFRRQHKNNIKKKFKGGEWLTKIEEVKGPFYDHFEIFNDHRDIKLLSLGSLIHCRLNKDESAWLD